VNGPLGGMPKKQYVIALEQMFLLQGYELYVIWSSSNGIYKES